MTERSRARGIAIHSTTGQCKVFWNVYYVRALLMLCSCRVRLLFIASENASHPFKLQI